MLQACGEWSSSSTCISILAPQANSWSIYGLYCVCVCTDECCAICQVRMSKNTIMVEAGEASEIYRCQSSVPTTALSPFKPNRDQFADETCCQYTMYMILELDIALRIARRWVDAWATVYGCVQLCNALQKIIAMHELCCKVHTQPICVRSFSMHGSLLQYPSSQFRVILHTAKWALQSLFDTLCHKARKNV